LCALLAAPFEAPVIFMYFSTFNPPPEPIATVVEESLQHLALPFM